MPSATILTVDDDHLQLDVLELLLSKHGYTILRAYNGEEALRTFHDHPELDLMLLDVMLPGDIDGLDVCRRIRADQSRVYVPIVMVTALGQTEQIARGLDAGADDYVTKPFSQREILARVHAALRVRKIQRDLAEAQYRYRVLVETTRDVIFALDAGGRLIYVSPACELLTGYTPETILADEQPFVRFVHPHDARRVMAWLDQRLQRAPDGSDLEFRITRADHQLRWAALSWNTIYDRAGMPIGLQGTIRDITHRKHGEAATWRRSQELAALNLIAARINQSLELKTALGDALDALLEVIGVEIGAIYVAQDQQLTLGAMRGLPELEAQRAFDAVIDRGDWQTRDLMLVRERADETPQQLSPQIKAHGLQALLSVPLRQRDEPNGVLILASRIYEKFDPTEVTLISTAAEQISVAITNARLFEDARHHAEELTLLNEIGHMLTATLDLDKVLRVIMEATVSILRGEAGSVLLLDDATGELVFAAAVGAGADKVRGVRLPAGAGIAGRVLREGQSLLVNDTQHDQQFYRDVDRATGLTTRTLMAAPLRARDRLIGVMEVINKRGSHFAPADLRLLDLLTPSAASAIENARLYARETQLSDQVRRHNRELRTLHAISAALIESLEIQTVLDVALAVLQAEFEYDRGHIELQATDGRATTTVHYPGTTEAACAHPAVVARFIRATLDARGVKVLSDTTVLAPREAARWRAAHIGAIVAAPLWGHDRVQGVLHLIWQQPHAFDDATAPLLAAIGQQIGVAIERAHLYEVAQHRAQEIERSHKQLVQSEKLAATGRLAMSLAHEINNPLQAIQNCLHLVLEFSLDDERKAYYLSMAREEVERLSVLVQSMLDFYRPGRSEQPIADVQNVIERVLTLSEQKLRNNRIEVKLDFAPTTMMAQIAPDQLGQVCLNLIMNAADAMSDGGALWIEAKPIDGWIETRIVDNGPGIASTDLPHIFEPFYTTKTEGTGLGLAISYSIIERSGGTLQVESELGQGAAFTIRLPKT
jgi:two-component system NtrC family sensor kinase